MIPTEDLLRELCDLLSIYPASTPQQILDAVLFLRSDADSRQFTIHCLMAERATLLEALNTAGVKDIHGTPLEEIQKHGFRL